MTIGTGLCLSGIGAVVELRSRESVYEEPDAMALANCRRFLDTANAVNADMGSNLAVVDITRFAERMGRVRPGDEHRRTLAIFIQRQSTVVLGPDVYDVAREPLRPHEVTPLAELMRRLQLNPADFPLELITLTNSQLS